MQKETELPEWFINLFLDFRYKKIDLKEKPSSLVIEETDDALYKGVALFDSETKELGFYATKINRIDKNQKPEFWYLVTQT